MSFDRKTIHDALCARMFTGKLVENRWRGDLVEEFVSRALEPIGWKHCSGDWKSWDLECACGLKMQVKQTARRQTWGVSPGTNRYGIGAAKGFYEGAVWKQLLSPARLAEVYVFAHHPFKDDAADHWDAAQWSFYVAKETELPNAKSVSVSYVTNTWETVGIEQLSLEVERVCARLKPNGRTNYIAHIERRNADEGESDAEPS